MRLYRQPRVGEWVRERDRFSPGSVSFCRVERVTEATAFLSGNGDPIRRSTRGTEKGRWGGAIGVDLVSAEFVAAIEAHKTALDAWNAREPADAAGIEVRYGGWVYVSLSARLDAIDTLDAKLRAAADQISAIRAWLAVKPVAPTEAQYPLPNGGE